MTFQKHEFKVPTVRCHTKFCDIIGPFLGVLEHKRLSLLPCQRNRSGIGACSTNNIMWYSWGLPIVLLRRYDWWLNLEMWSCLSLTTKHEYRLFWGLCTGRCEPSLGSTGWATVTLTNSSSYGAVEQEGYSIQAPLEKHTFSQRLCTGNHGPAAFNWV